jgi:hypothetical protein
MAVFAACFQLSSGDGFLTVLRSSVGKNPILFLPIIAFAIACAIRRARQVTGATVMPESAAPHGITPPESGMLLHEHIASREVAATLVDLSAKNT